MIRYQVELFLLSLAFLTRVPVPASLPFSEQRLRESARFFPLVGLFIGAALAAVFAILSAIFPASVAVALTLAFSIRLTGAFHEDGFADACDGLGGGFERSQILAIMKDSRIGTYGALGSILMLATKGLALYHLAEQGLDRIAIAFIVAHPASRLGATALNVGLPYVREDADSKAKPLARELTLKELLVASFFGLLPLILLPIGESALVFFMLIAMIGLAARFYMRRLGGYTGDLLGAAQQVAELGIYLALLASPTLLTLSSDFMPELLSLPER